MASSLIRPAPLRRSRWLHGVSAVAFATALGVGQAHAQLAALHGAAHVPASAVGAPSIAVPVVPGLSTATPSMTSAALRTLQNANKAQQAVNLVLQAQAAARQTAAAMPIGISNGLALGGLVPVANPVAAVNDPTGLNTWDGAALPTQTTANGLVTVNIQQTASRAVLDWQTFNVGANTTLNFDQSQNGVAQPGWVALNRVVGQLDPATGLRNPNLAPAPSQILGAIKAQGTVLVINQNGILFSPTAQINTNSLIATSLEIGDQLTSAVTTFDGAPVSSLANVAASGVAATLAQRDDIFLNDGFIGQGIKTLSALAVTVPVLDTNGKIINANNTIDPAIEGPVTVAAGAQITSGEGGYIILAAPSVTNAGALAASQGQVSLVSGRSVILTPSSGAATADSNPDIRGLSISSDDVGQVGDLSFSSDSVTNTATGLIQSSEGYASLTSTVFGSVTNAGAITATTSVSRNGYVEIAGLNITLAPTSVIAITPLDSGTIPQDPNSLADFKPSVISIGEVASNGTIGSGANVDIGANSLIYAPNASVNIDELPGANPAGLAGNAISPQVFIDSGAVIDVSGLKNVQVSGASQLVTIQPVTANDTADTPSQRSTLDHTTVTVDPRISGVRSDGVVWVGSPLIPAQAFADQIGVSASQLMTKGGTVVIGGGGSGTTPGAIIKPGATIDVSGGWVTYTAGRVQTTNLITANGTVVNIANASPDQTYLGVYNGFTATQPRFGISTTYANPLLSGASYDPAYTQGGDAGALILKTAQPILQGTVYANAYAGPLQAQGAQVGTATPTLFGDQRSLQAAGSQLPAGGLLLVADGPSGITEDAEIVASPTLTTTAGLTFGQSPTTPTSGSDAFILSAPSVNAMGLGQLSVYTAGSLTVDTDATVSLTPGGVFAGLAGHAITVDGAITAPSGAITLQSGAFGAAAPTGPGEFDVTVNGQLSTAGLWINDYQTNGAAIRGAAYINGGSITVAVGPRDTALGASGGGAGGDIALVTDTQAGTTPTTTTDISGSILIDAAASLLDVSAGGYVAPNGALTLTAKGGDVTLNDPTTYFPFYLGQNAGGALRADGLIPGFRVNGIDETPYTTPSGTDVIAVNPDAIASQVAIGDGAIRGYGFSSGGTFSLTTPAIAFAGGIAATGTNLPLDFFSKAGFGTYNITSYATNLSANTFDNGFGGFNAVLATQVLTVQNGQTLNLTQTGYSNHLSGAQIGGLRNLASGGQLSSIVAPGVQPDGFDQHPISLTLGGLVEFEVAPGGQVVGAAGASLSASQIYNQGVISLPGGTLTQVESLPAGYVGLDQGGPTTVFSAPTLSAIFSTNPDGSIYEAAPSLADPSQTNAQVAANDYVYLIGDLPASVGIELAPGSVTNLSGTVLVNPYAPGVTQGRQIATGSLVDGGTLSTATTTQPTTSTLTTEIYLRPGLALNAQPGARIDLAGASAVFDQLTDSGQYVQAPQWSNGGALTIGSGGTVTGAVIDAQGGATQATGGVLTAANLTLTQVDPATPTANVLSAQAIEAAGFGTLVVQGDLTATGAPVDLTLGQGFYLTGAPLSTLALASGQPVIPQSSITAAGSLQINAPYVSLSSLAQAGAATLPSDPATTATGNVTFNAQALDVTGAVLFDQSVAKVNLTSSGDLRFLGVEPVQLTGVAPPPTLVGQLAVNGDLILTAAQVYATTGSTFAVTSTAATGTIKITSVGTTPATPFSAGSNLTIQAANIIQDGVLRAPIGSLTLGGNTPFAVISDGVSGPVLAPATTSLTLGPGSITSVSADGLSIPYGTTTDQTEYFFSPTSSGALSAPPAAVLTLSGQTVTTAPGATVDLAGGGDVFAYEFIPGTGGSRDVLSQLNADAFTSNDGYQYADHRQVYAIVPGLSNAAVAAYDPIYSSNYGPLYAPSSAGQRVYLNGGQGVAAGWYTLLPAQYAVLPGGMEVVEDTSAITVPVGASVLKNDGSVAVTGEFGGLGGAAQSAVHVFDIKSRPVINSYSDIALTSGDATFAAQAATDGVTTPRLPLDAARLVLNPLSALDIGGAVDTTPGQGGRGSEVDITGASIEIVAQIGSAAPGLIQLSADQLTGLNADSLLIGGLRTDNSDGTTSLAVTAGQITLANTAAHPLSAPDIVLVADSSAGGITLNDGATLTATGTDTTGQTGVYVIDGAGGQTAQGALVRVSAGPARLVTRQNQSQTAPPGVLTIGAANLNGASVLLDASGELALSPSASLTASNIALDSLNIAFAPSAVGLTGLVITPSLAVARGDAASLSLRSPNVIPLADGAYAFNNLDIDTPGLDVSSGAGAVTITAQAVQVQNSFADAGACDVGGPACGAGLFALNGQSLTFGDGTFRIYGAGAGVTLSAPMGVVYQGQGALNVDAAPLTIQTAFLGDQAAPNAMVGVPTVLPSLAIATTGDLVLSNPTAAAAPTVAGVPGASLTLAGDTISVAGVDVRATAGNLTVSASNGLSVGAGATLETPGFSKSFGDAADPYSISAPGGLLTLSTVSGNIALAAGSTLSVGGGVGTAGALTLNASQGVVSFNGTLNGAAPSGGAGFALNEAGAFDLTGFVTAAGAAFTGDIAIQTGVGDLTLAAGQTLKATGVNLTADGGGIDIGGTIDVSGVNGGNVGLFGTTGVTLASGSLIAARASGYGPTDTRQASGGQVELGTAGAGALTIAAGAVIDVSAAQTSPRVVEGEENGLTTYDYVAADQGGTVIFRAPVSGADHAETVNVSVAGAVDGASSIILEGYRPYDLGAIAAGGVFSGVTVADGVATLDTTATGKPNFLADNAPGTLVDFIQIFDISASYANLGGLAAQTNFHARPGVELDYSGAVTLASNWNLGAGVVDVAGAAAAGLAVADPSIPGAYSVLPGDEGAVFANYTKLTYRVDGAVLGEPGVLTLKAGGQLNIDGSITDGFFTFGDQTDPTFLNTAIGASAKVYNGVLTTKCSVSCTTVSAFTPTTPSTNAVAVSFPAATGLGSSAVAAGANLIPYDAAANTASALGSGAGGAGDPIGSAEIFPLVATASGPLAVNSWSYQLTGGAAAGSANPLRVQEGAASGLAVQGVRSYTYGGVKPTTSFTDTLLLNVNGQQVTANQWLSAQLATNPTLTASSLTNFSFSSAPSSIRSQLETLAANFFKANPSNTYKFTGSSTAPTAVATSLSLAAQFLQVVAADWSALKVGYTPPNSAVPVAHTVIEANLIRTGTGSIALAAAGDIDLRGGATPTLLSLSTGAVSGSGYQLGGAAIYTAGALVVPAAVSAVDTTTGGTVTLDPSALETLDENIGALTYGYGVGTSSTAGLSGILVSNPVYVDGGGNVSVDAGGDVLGRRDVYTQVRVEGLDNTNSQAPGPDFIGWYDQPWRMGTVGSPSQAVSTNILVNPQLFTEGVGTLGGGAVRVKAGGSVSDITVVADTTITTGAATGGVAAGQVDQGEITFGGGDVAVIAGGDLLGGRIDVASGAADLSIGGGVLSAGAVQLSGGLVDSTLRLRLTDASVDLTAHGDVDLQGIAALGVQNIAIGSLGLSNNYAENFYSSISGIAVTNDGSFTLNNNLNLTGFDLSVGVANTIAVLPGSVSVSALGGDINLNTNGNVQAVLLDPSSVGTLTLAAGADIAQVNLAMLDSEPGSADAFPVVLPSTTFNQLVAEHDPAILHKNDAVPNRIYAGGDIDNLVISVPKQTRIGAGRDIVNMVFFGQNINSNDVTRIVAGRDITATTLLENAQIANGNLQLSNTSTQESVLQGNTFVLGGPGSLMLEAGRNLGPFLTSAIITTSSGEASFGGGVITVGNTWDPNLGAQGASIYAQFGVAKGEDFNALTSYYLDPANTAALPDYLFNETLNANNVYVPDKTQPIYAPQLIAYMQADQAQALVAAFGTTAVSYNQAYQAFAALAPLQQRPFLLQVYFHELSLTSTPGPTFDNYQRGYTAVNLLFPSSLGYTANDLTGGTNGANTLVKTGDLDLRLATIQTQFGGNIDILGPGGRVLAGSTVATAQQAARRYSDAAFLYAGNSANNEQVGGLLTGLALGAVNVIDSIPAGYEGVLTLRGGGISTFTDGDVVLNQSRLFTEQGGDVIMWSSNGDLNAGEGPKTSSNFPPVVVTIDENAFSTLDQTSGVTGAGIAAFEPAPGVPAPDVFLIAPRGTVDAGAAGVRVAGNLFVAALHVSNADNFQVAGTAIGLPPASTTVNISSESSSASSAATKAAQDAVARSEAPSEDRSIITVDILGFGDPACANSKDPCKQ